MLKTAPQDDVAVEFRNYSKGIPVRLVSEGQRNHLLRVRNWREIKKKVSPNANCLRNIAKKNRKTGCHVAETHRKEKKRVAKSYSANKRRNKGNMP